MKLLQRPTIQRRKHEGLRQSNIYLLFTFYTFTFNHIWIVCVCVLPGLEAQLLGIVVRKERPELEEQKDALVINIAANKKKLEELEDEILR